MLEVLCCLRVVEDAAALGEELNFRVELFERIRHHFLKPDSAGALLQDRCRVLRSARVDLALQPPRGGSGKVPYQVREHGVGLALLGKTRLT